MKEMIMIPLSFQLYLPGTPTTSAGGVKAALTIPTNTADKVMKRVIPILI